MFLGAFSCSRFWTAMQVLAGDCLGGGPVYSGIMAFLETVGRLSDADSGPLYLRLQALLRDAIDSGMLKAEQALPSERDLCEAFSLSRVTVRRAIGGLIEERRLVRRQGAGTFVSAGSARRDIHLDKSFSALSSFSEDMIARGFAPSTRWLALSQGLVTPAEALSLALSPGTPVYRLQRLRLADGRPMAIENSTVAGYCLPSLDGEEPSLYAALDRAGNRPVRALQRLRAIVFSDDQAQLLEVGAGHAGLMIERRSFLRDGRAAEVTVSFYRGDAYDFVAELNTL